MKKHITLILTSSVAIIKIKTLVEILKPNFDLTILATKNVKKNYSKLDEFNITTLEKNITVASEHTMLSQKTDLVLVAPASSNTIAKFRWGIADNMISTFLIAARTKIIFVPAMNTVMYESLLQRNIIEDIEKMNHSFIGPVYGKLFENEVGMGRMEEPKTIASAIEDYFLKKRSNKKILIAYGPGKMDIDDVRYITNKSSGTFGKLIFNELNLLGLNVKKINIFNYSNDQVLDIAKNFDIFISPAAFSDLRTEKFCGKMNKNSIKSIEVEISTDVVGNLKKFNQNIKIFAFKLDEKIENAVEKKEKYNLDAIFFNRLNSFGDKKISGSIFFEDQKIGFKNKSKNQMAKVIAKQVLTWI